MTQETRIALLAGASGLVGSHQLDALLQSPDYGAVIALTRRPLERQHPKLVQRIVDFDRLDACELPHIDDAFCCLGTTIKVAGSKEAFRKVDFDYAIAFARLALNAEAQQLLLVTSMGANPASPFFYMRVKGELEAAIRQLAYRSTSIFRPAYLVGKRTNARPLEDLSGKLMLGMDFLMPRKYRPVLARSVAAAMLEQARHHPPGFHVIESDLALPGG